MLKKPQTESEKYLSRLTMQGMAIQEEFNEAGSQDSFDLESKRSQS